MDSLAGQLLGIGTVLCWTLSVQFFAFASKRIGSVSVNVVRISVALLLFSLLLFCREGLILPIHYSLHCWLLLGLSGIVGFFVGDIFLFQALVELGPRLTMLVQTLSAPVAALIGWIFLDERYGPAQWLGMFVTLAGVLTVVLEKNSSAGSAKALPTQRGKAFGGWCAFLAMLAQASGLILSKAGMRVDTGYVDAFGATQIRAFAAFVCFVIFILARGNGAQLMVAIKDSKAVIATAIGSALGPFLGVSLSLWTLHYLSAGVAATFFSLVPICIIPFAIFYHKERVSFRAIAGAVVAVVGVYLLIQ